MLWQPRPGLICGRSALDPVAVPLTPTTWDAGTVSAVNLSGGNLIATNTGTTSTNQGAHAPSTAGKTSGKIYFEIAFTTITSTSGSNLGFGIGTTASTFANMGNSAITGVMVYQSGNVWRNNVNLGGVLGVRASGDVVAIAVDFDNLSLWFKKVSGTPGNWNNNFTGDPANNVFGFTVPAGTMIPFVTMGGTGGAASNVVTLNAGPSGFTGIVPNGFTAGWSA